MTFTESIRSTLTVNYAKFSGRASRSEYWWFQLFFVLVVAFFSVIMLGVIGAEPGALSPAVLIFLGIGILVFFLPQLGLSVRRLHDRNMSGWWMLLFIGLRVLGKYNLFFSIIGLISGIVLIVLFILPGTTGPNRFGQDPLKPVATADVFA